MSRSVDSSGVGASLRRAWLIAVHVALVLLLPLAILGALDLDRWLRDRRANDPSYDRLPMRQVDASTDAPRDDDPSSDLTASESPPEPRRPFGEGWVGEPYRRDLERDEPDTGESIPEAVDGATDPPDSLGFLEPGESPDDQPDDLPAESFDGRSSSSQPPRVARAERRPARPGLYDPLGLDADEIAARRAAPLSIEKVPLGPDIVYLDELRRRNLTVPVQGVTVEDLYDSFRDPRSGGRVHEAMDIMAPKGTPVVAVDHGTIARKYESRLGGITIYQFGRQKVFSYYYAHLDRYAPGLKEGDTVRPGQVIGYVGSSGNASADAPHLHFGVYVLGDEKRWWRGDPINPFRIWRPDDD